MREPRHDGTTEYSLGTAAPEAHAISTTDEITMKDKGRSRRRTYIWCSGGCQASAVTAARSNSAPPSFSVSHSQPPSRGARQRNIRTEPYSFPGSPRLTLGMGPTHIPNTRWSSTCQTVVEQGHRAHKERLRCEFTADSPKCRMVTCGGPAVRRSREISSGTRRTSGQPDLRFEGAA
jgi:hypothetical protein